MAVQASRLSTALHRVATPGHLPEYATAGCITPWSAFFGKSMSYLLLNKGGVRLTEFGFGFILKPVVSDSVKKSM